MITVNLASFLDASRRKGKGADMSRCSRAVTLIGMILVCTNACAAPRDWLLPSRYAAHTTSKGTLIVVVPCQEGIIVAADTRLTNEKGLVSDCFRKLRPVGNDGVFAIAGNTLTAPKSDERSPIDVKPTADFHDLMQGYFSKTDLSDSADDPNRLCKDISALYASLLGKMSREQAKEAASESQGILFSMVVVAGNRNGISRWLFRGYFEEKHPLVGCRVEVETLPEGPYFVGRTEVAAEIRNGNRKLFDGLRQDKTIRSFLANPPIATVLPNRALKFAQRMILETSKMGCHLDVPHTVGPQADCALVALDGGVKWLVRVSKTKE